MKLQYSFLLSIFKIFLENHPRPYFITVEPVNFCNLHCPECEIGSRANPVERRRFFDLKLFFHLVDELKSSLFHIQFYFQGEPFINKHLATMINYAHNAQIYTSVSTNGHFINKDVARSLVQSGLDKIIFSVDGCTQEVYELYRVGGDLKKVESAISLLVETKIALNSVTPSIHFQFIVFKSNEHQIKDARDYAMKLGVDRFCIKSAQIANFENANSNLTSIPRYSRYRQRADGSYELKGSLKNYCRRLWMGAVVNVYGEVLPCCFDKNSEHSFGSLDNYRFTQIWNGKNAFGFRKKILENRKQLKICLNCTNV